MPQACSRSRPISPASIKSRTRPRSPRCSAARPAPTSIRSTRRTSETENLFGAIRHPGAQGRRSGAVHPAGRPRHARPRLLPLRRPQDGRPAHRLSQAYIADLLKAANVADADAKAQRVFALEMKIAKAHVAARKATTGRPRAACGSQPTSPRRRRVSTGAPSSKARTSPATRPSMRITRGDHRPVGARRQRAAGCVEGLAGVPPDQQPRRRAAGHDRQPAFRLLRQAAVGPPKRSARVRNGRSPR